MNSYAKRILQLADALKNTPQDRRHALLSDEAQRLAERGWLMHLTRKVLLGAARCCDPPISWHAVEYFLEGAYLSPRETPPPVVSLSGFALKAPPREKYPIVEAGQCDTLADWLSLLWILHRPNRRSGIRKLVLAKKTLTTLRYRYVDLSRYMVERRCIRAELRRRALSGLALLLFGHLRAGFLMIVSKVYPAKSGVSDG